MAEKILVTGASGFIGSFVVQEALKRGLQVWAGIRSTSSRQYLADKQIQCIELDFAQPERLVQQLSVHCEVYGRFDYIVHCAGITKAVKPGDFETVNFRQTQTFIDTLYALDMVPRQFIYLSSLSVYGPVHERDYAVICESDRPQPDTLYGQSKLKAEQYMRSLDGFPYVILRPTGVYGPRERDYFLMAKAVSRHVDVSVGFKKQILTFVYVMDLVEVIFQCIGQGVVQKAYFVSDGEEYHSSDFSRLIQKELGKRRVLRLTFPLFVLKAVSLLANWFARQPSTLNTDKYNIMKQRNWRCDISSLVKDLNYQPKYNLRAGVAETIRWYKENSWL